MRGEKVRCLLKRRVARLPFKTTFEERKRMIDKPFGEMKVGDSSVWARSDRDRDRYRQFRDDYGDVA